MAKKRGAPGLVEQLREGIRLSGRSLSGIGEESGVSPSQLSRFMRGERGLTLDAAERVCRVLGLELAPARPAPRAPGKGRTRRGPRPGAD